MLSDLQVIVLSVVIPIIHVLGIAFAVMAIFRARSSQAAIAWGVGLVSFPYLAVPLYVIFGRGKFHGYLEARRSDEPEIRNELHKIHKDLKSLGPIEKELVGSRGFFERFAAIPFTSNNLPTLLVDGETTFEKIFSSIEKAKSYILVQFFIVKDDELGQKLKDILIKKANEGVKVYFLYDEIGSHSLSKKYGRALKQAGIHFFPFNSGRRSRFQLNFRNHRKIVVVDGNEGFVGGHNVGNEYLGKSKIGNWRDTHVEITGPAACYLQLAFLEDWHWATSQEIARSLNWLPQIEGSRNNAVTIVPTGPADQIETCSLLFTQLINCATKKFWIASPYFVPDESVLHALKLAALRGVDVRVMIPDKPDHLVVYLAAYAYIQRAHDAGIKVYRYHKGFLHQKVLVVDDDVSAIGTANLDNRSFRLNFEITALFLDGEFNQQVTQMLDDDFNNCSLYQSSDLGNKSLFFKILVRIAALFSPVL